MDDENNITKEAQSVKDSFKLDPPENSWNRLDAELERKQTLIYKGKTNRFKWLSAFLAILLISFITYQYFIPVDNSKSIVSIDKKSIASNGNTNNSINTAKNETIKKPSVDNNGNNGTQSETNELHTIANANEKKTIANEKQNIIANNETISIGNDKKEIALNKDKNLAAGVAIEKNNNVINPDEVIRNQDNLTLINIDNSLFHTDDLVNLAKHTEYSNLTTNDFQHNSPVNNVSRFSIAAFYSPNSSRNHLTDNTANSSDDITEYKNREKPIYSFSTGLSIRYDLNNKLSISSGCTYSTLAYSMLFSKIFVGYGSDNELHYQYPTSCGTIEMPNNYNKILHYGDSLNMNVNCAQVVKFISIPLVARYQFTHNRFSLYADAGLSANFMIQEQAKVSVWGKESTINNNIDGLKNLNFGYLLGVGLQYNFDTNLGIFIEPAFRGSVTSITSKTDVNCYPYSFGINTGVTFHF